MDFLGPLLMIAAVWLFMRAILNSADENLKSMQAEVDAAKRMPSTQDILEELPAKTFAITFDQPTPDDIIIVHDQAGNYLCQGRSLSEMMSNFKDRFPEHNAIVIDPDAKEFFRKLSEAEDRDPSDDLMQQIQKFKDALRYAREELKREQDENNDRPIH